jgi:SAM-dependent methyltransferase
VTDSTARFSNRVDDYAKYRPSYPRAAIEAILEGFDSPAIADLGAGTGISSRLLAERGTVYAVEPNAGMRGQIVADAHTIPVDGTAEATTLPDACVDIVTAFQAYHWFDPAAVLGETERIGRPRVRFAAVWNERDGSDPFMREYQAAIDPYMTDATESKRRKTTVDGDLAARGWQNIRVREFRHEQPADWDQLIGRTRSASYLPREGPAYEAMAAHLRALYDRADSCGGARFVLIATVHLAERQ